MIPGQEAAAPGSTPAPAVTEAAARRFQTVPALLWIEPATLHFQRVSREIAANGAQPHHDDAERRRARVWIAANQRREDMPRLREAHRMLFDRPGRDDTAKFWEDLEHGIANASEERLEAAYEALGVDVPIAVEEEPEPATVPADLAAEIEECRQRVRALPVPAVGGSTVYLLANGALVEGAGVTPAEAVANGAARFIEYLEHEAADGNSDPTYSTEGFTADRWLLSLSYPAERAAEAADLLRDIEAAYATIGPMQDTIHAAATHTEPVDLTTKPGRRAYFDSPRGRAAVEVWHRHEHAGLAGLGNAPEHERAALFDLVAIAAATGGLEEGRRVGWHARWVAIATWSELDEGAVTLPLLQARAMLGPNDVFRIELADESEITGCIVVARTDRLEVWAGQRHVIPTAGVRRIECTDGWDEGPAPWEWTGCDGRPPA